MLPQVRPYVCSTTATRPRLAAISFGEVVFDCFDDGSRVIGGAPFNVAVHVARFGIDSWLCSAIGDDGG